MMENLYYMTCTSALKSDVNMYLLCKNSSICTVYCQCLFCYSCCPRNGTARVGWIRENFDSLHIISIVADTGALQVVP